MTNKHEQQRWAVLLEYDGTNFVGWQSQKYGSSVQDTLESAAKNLAHQQTVKSVTAGRTDSGVHAWGQVAHLDFPIDLTFTEKSIRDGLNYHMKPNSVVVLAAKKVSSDFNARFSAISRSYRYIILNRPSRPTLLLNRVWHIPTPLDVIAMQQATQILVGKHDFSSFRASACQANDPTRTLNRLDVYAKKGFIYVDVEAKSFLHHQVRNIVGSLKLVGSRHWSKRDLAQALSARKRSAAGPTAPAEGLYLREVNYDTQLFPKSSLSATIC